MKDATVLTTVATCCSEKKPQELLHFLSELFSKIVPKTLQVRLTSTAAGQAHSPTAVVLMRLAAAHTTVAPTDAFCWITKAIAINLTCRKMPAQSCQSRQQTGLVVCCEW
jgi:hypothetical protein